jgi:SAM-dependent methyltransferase
VGSEPYRPDNFLDRHTDQATLEVYYRQIERREAELLAGELPPGGEVLSVGAGLYPGRHVFPAPAWHLVAVDADPGAIAVLEEQGSADETLVADASSMIALADERFDVLLMRLLLHHLAYRGSLEPALREARRVLRPGGLLVATEPNRRHPVGLALALANRAGVAERMHGTRDDIPLSPSRVRRDLLAAGFSSPQVRALTYSWRRAPALLQRATHAIDRLGAVPGLRSLGHTMLVTARR